MLSCGCEIPADLVRIVHRPAPVLEGGIKQQAGRNCAWKSSASVVRSAPVGVTTMSVSCHRLWKVEGIIWLLRDLFQFEEFRRPWSKWELKYEQGLPSLEKPDPFY